MIQLKNLKVSASQSEETTAFTADLYFNGKLVATAKNNGRGGCNDYSFIDRDIQPIVEKFAVEELEGTELDFPFVQLDTYIGVLIEIAEILKKYQAKRLVFQKEFTDLEFTTVTPFTVSIKDAVQKMGQKATDHVYQIVRDFDKKGYKCLNTNI